MREGLSEQMGEATGDVRGNLLQRKVNQNVEDVRDGVNEPEKREWEEGCAKEARAAEKKDDARGVCDDHKRMRRQINSPLRRNHEDQNCLGAKEDGKRSENEQGEPPSGSLEVPSNGAPCAQNKGKADEGNQHADGFEGVGRPKRPEQVRRGPDAGDTEDGEQTSEAHG